jgi:molybdopterin-guanine dinucleotide biosynthesis protein A
LPEVIVVGPLRLQTLVPNTPVVPDETPGAGPVGGLATALAQVKSQHIFVMGCDMPFVEPELVGAMARYAADHPEADVVAVRAARGVEPLHTVYARSCQVAIRDLLASRDVRSLASLLKRLRVEELPTREVVRCDPAARSAFNANAPEDWREALAIHAQETNTAST